MGEDSKSSTQQSRITDKDKKRKCQGELVEIPWPKHVRRCSSEDESTLRNPDYLASSSGAISSELNSSYHSSETGGSRPESSSVSEGLNNYHPQQRTTESSSSGYYYRYGSNIEPSGNDGDDVDPNVHLEQSGSRDDDDLYSSGVGPFTHLILSENREEGTIKKPTIDKEFEEYFSALLL
ncbi:hypothetical protein M569_14737 [Genlisea aurea]|uniref:Uncharacterized protein n=1 Tax=Genlisea aurea TaxID=192259 RepID=S8BZP1_9LAMI|nr:hypothetical protein M569_14737 [Genlisea aurea]